MLAAKAAAVPDAASIAAAAETRAIDAALGPLAGFSREIPIRLHVTAGWKPGNIGADVSGFPSRRSEEHTSELQSLRHLVCRLLLEKKKDNHMITIPAHK